MSRVRNVALGLALLAGSTLLPADKADAALFDCCRRLLLVPSSYFVPTVATVAAPAPCAAVVKPACTVPCVTVLPTSICTTSYIRRTYLEPRVTYVTHEAIEARPRYVRRYYWDPVLCRYRTQLVAYTSFVKRYYQVPVTSYVVRSYLQPVTTCTTPACPAPVCPAPACPAPACPAPPSPSGPAPSSAANQPAAGLPAQAAAPPAGRSTARQTAVTDHSLSTPAESPWTKLEPEGVGVKPVSNEPETKEPERTPKSAALLLSAVPKHA